MRRNGVPSFPDPASEADVKIGMEPHSGKTGMDVDSPLFKKAEQACQKMGPTSGVPDPQTQPQEMPAGLKFARCMRSHGVRTFPDPQPGGGTVQAMPREVDTHSSLFNAAQQACRRQVPGLFGAATP
jgi:hypothetical protein